MKKLATLFIAGAMILSPVFALADTSASVQAMLTQIANLKAQLDALNTAKTNVTSTLTLIRSLKQGMSGDDVKALQAILAADPSIYPQGTISGFFGSLTAEAVKKFQKKHGIDALGLVGPQTLRALNAEKDNLGLSQEDNDDNGNATSSAKRLCIPPGHLIAPGWLKHNEKPVPTSLIPLCNNKGENNDRGDNHGSSDKTAPVISAITTSSLATSTKVMWNTDELSNSVVWFGIVNPVVFGSNLVDSGMATTSHSITLGNLATSTTYFYAVGSRDSSGNLATSSQSSFTTLAQ